MAIFRKFPYTNYHDLNLDWIIEQVKLYIAKCDILELDFKELKEYVDSLDIQEAVDNKLVIDLHIIVSFGVNIPAIVKSIVNKVKYTVEDATGLEVSKVNVFVDGTSDR